MTPGDLATALREAAETMPASADRLPATLRRAARLRRRRRGLAAAATAAAVAAVVGGSLLVPSRSADGPQPQPAASVPPGTPVGTVPATAARLTGTTLVLAVVGAPDTAPTDPCWHGYAAEATEAGRVVRVVVRDYVPDRPRAACSRMGQSRLVPVRLPGPLADRTVVDGSTGSAVTVFRDLLTLPGASGWTLRAESGGTSDWRQGFDGPGGQLLLVQGGLALGTLSDPSVFRRTGTATVRGTPATWGTAPGETSLHWVEGDRGIQLVSPDLDVARLVAVAAQLTR